MENLMGFEKALPGTAESAQPGSSNEVKTPPDGSSNEELSTDGYKLCPPSKESSTDSLPGLLSDTAESAQDACETAESAPSNSWENVVRDMVTMKPHFADKAKEAAAFCAAWSGGQGSPNLVEVEAYAKTLKLRREPEPGLLEMLANAPLKRAPRWPIACYKALLQAPDQFCRRKGEAAMFTNADIMPNVEETAESAPEDPILKAAKSD